MPMAPTATPHTDRAYSRPDLVFVLVAPRVAENVGAAARALKTMGFAELRLVDAPAIAADRQARIVAHGAGDVLDAAGHFDDLEAAVADCDFTVVTTARRRHRRRLTIPAADLADHLARKRGIITRTAIVFGGEESGLSNIDLDRGDLVSHIPLAAPYPSLNLGQAVMLYASALSGLAAADSTEPAPTGEYRALVTKVTALLTSAGIGAKEKPHQWALDRLAALSAEDVRYLHFVCDKLAAGPGCKR